MFTYQITFQHRGRLLEFLLQAHSAILVEKKFQQLAQRQWPDYKIVEIREYLR